MIKEIETIEPSQAVLLWNVSKDVSEITEMLILSMEEHLKNVREGHSNLRFHMSTGAISGIWMDPVTPEMKYTELFRRGCINKSNMHLVNCQFVKIKGMKEFLAFAMDWYANDHEN